MKDKKSLSYKVFFGCGARKKSTGMSTRVRQMAKARPNITENASGPQVAFEAASGIMPMTVVTVVITMGRSRVADDSTTTSMSGLSGSSCKRWIIESMRMMAWLMMTPPSAMMPSSDVKETGWPVSARPSRTPMSESGTIESR